MTKEEAINYIIGEEAREGTLDTNKIRDGYHSFGELYEHRIVLFICLCVCLYRDRAVWRSKAHADGSVWDGWFIMGINLQSGTQISYHLPIEQWDNTKFAMTLERAPEFDGHTSADVLERLKKL